MATYEKCANALHERVNDILEKLHLKRLGIEDVDVGCLWHIADKNEAGDVTGPPLKLNGYTCQAVIRIESLRHRVQGLPDATITIDQQNWQVLSSDEQDALLDHELEHLDVKRKSNA